MKNILVDDLERKDLENTKHAIYWIMIAVAIGALFGTFYVYCAMQSLPHAEPWMLPVTIFSLLGLAGAVLLIIYIWKVRKIKSFART